MWGEEEEVKANKVYIYIYIRMSMPEEHMTRCIVGHSRRTHSRVICHQRMHTQMECRAIGFVLLYLVSLPWESRV